MRIKKIYTPLLLGLATAIGVLVGSALDFNTNGDGLLAQNDNKRKLSKLIDYIEYEYVDPVDTDSIVAVTVNGILDHLDPHSVYISPEEAKRLGESMKGDFVGVGISYYRFKDSITVIKPIKGGPSYEAGIKGGDRIVSVNGTPVNGKALEDHTLETLLQGKVGTPVTLGIVRPGESRPLEVEVERGVVPLKSLVAAYMLNAKLGYIKLDRFAESTYDEFLDALKDLKKKGADQLVLDLRDNIGGFVYPAELTVDEFLEEGKLIVYTENKSGIRNYTYAKDDGIFEDGELYVLINENTASAAEIAAGALQDNDKGLIVGRRSFGKGLVQREMELGDGSSVRLTTARYYTPTGRSIQRPYNMGKEAYYNDYKERYEQGELSVADSIKVADSLKFTTPLGKVVYGGGGITPDIFIPKNTDYDMEHLRYVLRSGYMDVFIFEQLEKDRPYYNSLSEEQFIEEYKITEQFISDFISFAQARRISLKPTKYRETFKKYLKASMAQQLFGSQVFEKMINEDDAAILKVISLSTSDL